MFIESRALKHIGFAKVFLWGVQGRSLLNKHDLLRFVLFFEGRSLKHIGFTKVLLCSFEGRSLKHNWFPLFFAF